MKKYRIYLLMVFNFLIFSGVSMADNLERSKKFFTKLSIDHLQEVDHFYDKNAIFQDPVHKLQGADKIKNYYQHLYENVQSIRFEYGPSLNDSKYVHLSWKMYLKSSSISNKEITVDGVSVIEFGGTEGKAIFHRDYFDMGEFIYEKIPVLNWIISYIKGRLGNK